MSQTGAVSRRRTTVDTAQIPTPIECSTSSRGPLVCGSTGICSRQPTLCCCAGCFAAKDSIRCAQSRESSRSVESRWLWRRNVSPGMVAPSGFLPQGANKSLTAAEDLIARIVPESRGEDMSTPDQTVRCSKQVLRRYSMVALAAALSVLVHSPFADTPTFAFDIPREDLALALNQIAQQSHIEIAYSAELTRGKISPF